jgi:nucleotide-binding universal stress UspA family protein
MVVIESILGPIDNSRESRHALQCGLRLAVEHDARIMVLIVVAPLVPQTPVTGFDAVTVLTA